LPPLNKSWTAGGSIKISDRLDAQLTFNSISAVRGFAQDPVNYNNDGQPLLQYSPTVSILVSISDNYIVYRDTEATQELQILGKYNRFDFASGVYFLYEDFASNRIRYVVSPKAASPAMLSIHHLGRHAEPLGRSRQPTAHRVLQGGLKALGSAVDDRAMASSPLCWPPPAGQRRRGKIRGRL
jgi:hypothetical protein